MDLEEEVQPTQIHILGLEVQMDLMVEHIWQHLEASVSIPPLRSSAKRAARFIRVAVVAVHIQPITELEERAAVALEE